MISRACTYPRCSLPVHRRNVIRTVLLLGAAFVAPAMLVAQPDAAHADLAVEGKITLPSGVDRAHPMLADLDRDGRLDIVVGTEQGDVICMTMDPQLRIRWTAQYPYGIQSRPAAADLDGDGKLEVVVGYGDHLRDEPGIGGVLVLDANGAEKGLFAAPKLDLAHVESAPALADLNGDGHTDILFGSYNEHVYALRGDTLQSIWTNPYHQCTTCVIRNDPTGFRVGDTISAGPGVADFDRDGMLEMIIGVPTLCYPD
ncbi:MAG: VCBS repeat-containing protein, partial [Candidatus Schekmanbacteria bacterium]|nr:VCBS repeat-containing protein [Candidatus Schekmanbacteria bacterium]